MKGIDMPVRVQDHIRFVLKLQADLFCSLRSDTVAVQHFSFAVHDQRAAHGNDKIRVQEVTGDIQDAVGRPACADAEHASSLLKEKDLKDILRPKPLLCLVKIQCIVEIARECCFHSFLLL